jgi:surface polysaccharide O-acyltransferase-like enzyme
MWFVEALLYFSIVYAVGKAIQDKVGKGVPAGTAARKPLTNAQVLLFVVTLAVTFFVLRIFLPTGVTWHNWELGYFPQYILMFAAGILAHRYAWLPDLSAKISRPWKITAVASMLVLAPLMLITGGAGNLDAFNGGITLQSGVSSVWTAVYGVAMSILMLDLFRKRLDSQGRLASLLSQNAYTVYIVHAAVIVWLAYLTRGIVIDPFIKFFVMAPPAVILCFAISHLIRQIPYTQKVL